MSGVALGVGRGSKMVSNSADWLLRDEFITDLAAGSVNGTAAEPGPGGNRKEGLPENNSISGGLLATVSKGNLLGYHLYDALPITRAAGRMLIARVIPNTDPSVGWVNNTTPTAFGNLDINFATVPPNLSYYESAPVVVGAVTVGQTYTIAAILRPVGAFLLIRGGSQYTQWRLVYIQQTRSAATLYAHLLNFSSGATNYCDFMRVPAALWLPTPLASDGFGSAFGTTDGLGHAEGIAGGIGAGGSGLTWSNAGSTWSVSGGKAINTTPSGLSQQMSVAQVSTADVFASAALTRAAGSVGLAVSMDSASSPANGVLVYLDGTNCKVDKIVGGTTSNVRTTAVTYSAGARLVVAKNGSEYRVYYNNARVGTEQTISDAGIANNTLHGLFSTDASNTLDDFTCYATGSGGEYAELDKWS